MTRLRRQDQGWHLHQHRLTYFGMQVRRLDYSSKVLDGQPHHTHTCAFYSPGNHKHKVSLSPDQQQNTRDNHGRGRGCGRDRDATGMVASQHPCRNDMPSRGAKLGNRLISGPRRKSIYSPTTVPIEGTIPQPSRDHHKYHNRPYPRNRPTTIPIFPTIPASQPSGPSRAITLPSQIQITVTTVTNRKALLEL